MSIPVPRPAPIREAARKWSFLTGGILALVSFGLTANVLSADQAGAITAFTGLTDVLVAALVAVVTGVGPFIAAFRTASTSEPLVTPIADPRMTASDGNLVQLVPLAPHMPNAGQLDPESRF